MRTDRPRLRALVPDTDATIALRRACRARKDLVNHRVAVANQLRAHLRNVLPAAVGLFQHIDSLISLAFLTRFDTQDKIDWLSAKRLGDWLSKQGYSGKADPAVLHQRILAAPTEPAAPRHGPGPHHRQLRRTAGHPGRTNQSALDPDRGATVRPRRRPHLHLAATRWPCPRRTSARRDRGLPCPIPEPRIADVSGRRRAFDPPVRQI
ncbi:hypothetical protein MSEN_15350 [Mycolicibacter senuensis]|uniref:Uncharacterized protein n=1 Tax=Mycolicibacter senuensis TaxID=386913 RepID=A0A7I9XIM2_9MYCO|nr:hypothetical protein MSEN_15350 [Mycolicibacter senuensis]